MATEIAWVNVTGNEWTKIFEGPSIHILGTEVVEFTAFTLAQPAYTVAFTVHRYSGTAPFYYSQSGARTASPQGTFPLPTSSQWLLPAVTSSPWTVIWLFTDLNCRAHVLI